MYSSLLVNALTNYCMLNVTSGFKVASVNLIKFHNNVGLFIKLFS